MTGQHLPGVPFLPVLLASESMGYGFHCLRSWIFMNRRKAVEGREGCLMWLTWTSSCVSGDDLYARHWLYHVSSLLASFSWSFNSCSSNVRCTWNLNPSRALYSSSSSHLSLDHLWRDIFSRQSSLLRKSFWLKHDSGVSNHYYVNETSKFLFNIRNKPFFGKFHQQNSLESLS